MIANGRVGFYIDQIKKKEKINRVLYTSICVSCARYYSITCIQRLLKGSNESGLLQQVVFKCRFYEVDLRRGAVSEQWSLKAGGFLLQVVSNTGLTVLSYTYRKDGGNSFIIFL